MLGLVGRKIGMTRTFEKDGRSIPVTVIQALPNRITQIKSEKDGYCALQVTMGEARASRLNQAEVGHFKKANVQPGVGLWEFRFKDFSQTESFQLGSEVTVDLFEIGQKVDVAAVSKGKGFAGTIKRHNFAGQDRSHGNSVSHRKPGSIGQNQSPGKVFKGKKMAGQMGNKRCSILNQEIIRIDLERNLILIKGAVPGAPNGYVIVKRSVKFAAQRQEAHRGV